jgi:hypothetical protein
MMRHALPPGPALSILVIWAMLMPAATDISRVLGFTTARMLSMAVAIT